MRKALITIACAICLAMVPTAAAGGTIDLKFYDAYFVGQIIDGIPSSEAEEAEYINLLITLGLGQEAYLPNSNPGTDEFYSRLWSSLVASFPDAAVLDAVKDDGYTDAYIDNNLVSKSISVDGMSYVLGKYDGHNPGAGAFVWYVGGLTGTVTVPTKSPGSLDQPNGYGLSHTSAFRSVPDSGATLMLLGSALVGLAGLRRRFNL